MPPNSTRLKPDSSDDHLVPQNGHDDKKNEKLELLYDGVFYDITNWVKRHPGGNVIRMYANAGEDATHAVQQFHLRSSKKVMGIMKSLPNRTATEAEVNGKNITTEKSQRHRALTQDFLKLFKELQDEGLFKPSLMYTTLRILEIWVVGFWAINVLNSNPPWWLWTIAVLIGSLAAGRSGWVTHEGGHGSFTGRPKIDRLIESIHTGVGFGLSASYWSNQHNRHHAGPQHMKYDVDLNTLPLVAFNAAVADTKPKIWWKNPFIRHQKWIFYPLTTIIVAFGWQLVLHPIYVIRKRKWMDLTFMILHHYLAYNFLAGPEIFITSWLGSLYMFGNFTLSHTHLPVTNEPTHWVEYSLVHTMNIKSGWMNIIDYWMGYLNYQIEHHLFPTMPQFRNKLCRDRVKALAKKHGLPYHLASYTDGVRMAWKNLDNVAEELFD